MKLHWPDKAYDGNASPEYIKPIKALAVMPSRHNRKIFIAHDTENRTSNEIASNYALTTSSTGVDLLLVMTKKPAIPEDSSISREH